MTVAGTQRLTRQTGITLCEALVGRDLKAMLGGPVGHGARVLAESALASLRADPNYDRHALHDLMAMFAGMVLMEEGLGYAASLPAGSADDIARLAAIPASASADEASRMVTRIYQICYPERADTWASAGSKRRASR